MCQLLQKSICRISGLPYSRNFGCVEYVPSGYFWWNEWSSGCRSIWIEGLGGFILHAKSPRPDGYNVELYIGFYDLLKEDILKVVKDSRHMGYIHGSLNSTIICLVPKKKGTHSFEYYHPISCCNVIYKLVTKKKSIILKPILSSIIWE